MGDLRTFRPLFYIEPPDYSGDSNIDFDKLGILWEDEGHCLVVYEKIEHSHEKQVEFVLMRKSNISRYLLVEWETSTGRHTPCSDKFGVNTNAHEIEQWLDNLLKKIPRVDQDAPEASQPSGSEHDCHRKQEEFDTDETVQCARERQWKDHSRVIEHVREQVAFADIVWRNWMSKTGVDAQHAKRCFAKMVEGVIRNMYEVARAKSQPTKSNREIFELIFDSDAYSNDIDSDMMD